MEIDSEKANSRFITFLKFGRAPGAWRASHAQNFGSFMEMKTDLNQNLEPRRRWPWFLLGGLLLGIVLFILWLWVAVQKIKLIKAVNEGSTAKAGEVQGPLVWQSKTIEENARRIDES